MRWARNLPLSARALSRSPGRTALSSAAMAVGIASVVALLGAGAGAREALRQALDPLGGNLLVVNPARTESGPLRGASRIATTLRVEDWQAIAREVNGVSHTAPVAERSVSAQARSRQTSVRVAATTPAFEQVRAFPVVAGRFLRPYDLEDRRRVAVVGTKVVEEVFRGESPLDRTVDLGGVPFRIVGVTRKKGISYDGANEDELVFIPLTTGMRRLLNMDSLSRVYLQAVSEENLPAVASQTTAVLQRRHQLSPGEEDDFVIRDQASLIRARAATGGSLSRLMVSLSILALGLSGVGLLAVLLLSVRERYPEIGLRLAVGGRPRDVFLQFLAESIGISLLGGVAGLGLGAVVIVLGARLTRWPMLMSWEAVVYPLAISAGIAVIFGVYPALRAARLDPILALNSK